MNLSERGRLLPPDLDDRKWKDLANDARSLIPTYAPQWTDHNPSDVGMTLIELFAFFVENLIYRLNRVPEKNYIAFLNLLGITRDPQTPARAFLTFTAAPAAVVLVPKGTQAQTRASETDPPVVFETDEDVTVLPTNLKVALQIGKVLAANKYANVSNRFTVPPAEGDLVTIQPGQSVMLCFGFDQQTAQEIRLQVRLFRPLQSDPATNAPQAAVAWLYSKANQEPGAWSAIPGAVDDTQGLTRDGTVRFTVPGLWASRAPTAWTTVSANSLADQVANPFFWIGLRISNLVTAPIRVGINFILFNTASAHNALTIPAAEPLGTSNGKPFQAFALKHRPLFKRVETDTPYDHLVIHVGGIPWTQKDELERGPGNFYRVNPVAGEISFGDYDSTTNPDGHGTISPAGTAVDAVTYRYAAGGTSGNVGAGTIAELRTPVAGIVAVNNLFSSYGASDEEAIEDTKRRAPEVLRNRYRAVTDEDYEYLAREATTDVAIVRCLEPRVQDQDFLPNWKKGDPWTFGSLDRSPGNVNLIVVPDYGPNEPRPQPGDDLVREMQRYLDKRRSVTARLIVTGPRYLPIKATVEVSVFQRAIDNGVVANAAAVAADVRSKVERFFDPVRGGVAGKGWTVGQTVFIADLFKAIAPNETVGFVSNLSVEPLVPVYHDPPLGPGGVWNDSLERPFTLALGTPRSAVRLADYELVCSAFGTGANAHNVTAIVVT